LDLQGSIEKFTLPEIFQLLAAGRKSGTLGIQREDSIVMIYFEAGDITYGYGPRQTYHLGRLLTERGIISPQQLQDAVETQARTDNTKRLGEIMIQKGFVDRADLQGVIHEQIKELLYSLLSWQSGSFKFYENQFPTDEEVKIRLSVEDVILEGLRRVDEQNLVHDTFPDLEQVYTISASQAGRTRSVTMKASEWNIMALVDGRRSLDQICQASPLDREQTLNRLAQLKLSGLITKVDRKAESKTESPGVGGSSNLEALASRLGRLLEDYLTEKTAPPTGARQITRTAIDEHMGVKIGEQD